MNQKLSTPWGPADLTKPLAPGALFVSTPSHGGVMVDPAQQLSGAATARAIRHGGALFFEEDCDWAIVACERPEWFPDVSRDDVIRCCSQWNPEYLLAVGITPEPEAYAEWQAWREDDRLRAEKSPRLIVCASSPCGRYPWIPQGFVGVFLADGSHGLVPETQYKIRRPNVVDDYNFTPVPTEKEGA